MVHQPVSPCIRPVVQLLRQSLSTNPGVQCDVCTVVSVVWVYAECEGDSNTGVGEGGGVIVVSAVCEMCMCLAQGSVEGEGGKWMRGLGLGFTNPVGTGGVLDMCMCLDCGGVGGEWVEDLEKENLTAHQHIF